MFAFRFVPPVPSNQCMEMMRQRQRKAYFSIEMSAIRVEDVTQGRKIDNCSDMLFTELA